MTSADAPRGRVTRLELFVVTVIVIIISIVLMNLFETFAAQSRDANRISALRQIQYGLDLYYLTNQQYPTCLYPGTTCASTLEGSQFMPKVPRDPLTGVGYTYAALGSGSTCNSYHIGTSLEIKTNLALLSGADAPKAAVCAGSALDFSGLSAAPSGQTCVVAAGTAQPGGTETCYDLKP